MQLLFSCLQGDPVKKMSPPEKVSRPDPAAVTNTAVETADLSKLEWVTIRRRFSSHKSLVVVFWLFFCCQMAAANDSERKVTFLLLVHESDETKVTKESHNYSKWRFLGWKTSMAPNFNPRPSDWIDSRSPVCPPCLSLNGPMAYYVVTNKHTSSLDIHR